jgi:SAM-dependent methyltransferase
VPDETFDDIYPPAVKAVSDFQWTPIRVCVRIAELLSPDPSVRILDVGSGAGKFCIAIAALTGAAVRGIELHPELVDVAREAARRYRVKVELAAGSFEHEDPAAFDVVYLFNPFVLPLIFPGTTNLPADGGAKEAARAITAAEQFLEAARPGTRVVTYCGFGGAMPSCFERRAQERWDGSFLELWTKTV